MRQIPRDSYLETERWGPIKINALYGLAGEEALKQELSERMGTPIRHHVIVNLAALRHLADLVGGIEVTVPKRLYYVDNSQGLMIDLQPGRQTLKGASWRASCASATMMPATSAGWSASKWSFRASSTSWGGPRAWCACPPC